VIDRTYPLTDAAAAVELVEEGSPAGKVIVVVEPPPKKLPPPSPQMSQRLKPHRFGEEDAPSLQRSSRSGIRSDPAEEPQRGDAG
jgi:hypothetical protein